MSSRNLASWRFVYKKKKKKKRVFPTVDPLAFALTVSTRASVFSNSEWLRKPFPGHISEELTHVSVRLGEL